MGNKILISSCLLGEPVRYDGKAKSVTHAAVSRWLRQNRLVQICPEVAGGLSTPRDAAEIGASGFNRSYGTGGKAVLVGAAAVITESGENVTDFFVQGARAALELVEQYSIKWALLKANSPSCGNRQIYSGQFDGILVRDRGVTAELLYSHGVQVFNETEITLLCEALGEED